MIGDSLSPDAGVWIAIAIVAIGVGLVAIAPATGQSSSADNISTVDDPDLSLDELRDSGTTLPEAPRGIRSDGSRLWWLEYWPADAVLGDPGSNQDSWSEYVDTSTTVDRSSVYLRTVVVDESVERTVNVAYWTTETREVSSGNGTTEREVVDELIVEQHKIDMGSGIPIQEIPLQRFDSPRQVTLWIDDGPRWTFTYDPVETSAPIAVETVGDFLGLAGLWILLPGAIGIFAGGSIARRAIQRTGLGPGYPIGAWLIGLGLVLGIIVLFAFDDLASLIGNIPWIMGIAIGGISLIVVLESQAVRQREIEFIRPEISAVAGPDGSDQIEILETDRRAETVVDMPDGDPAVVRPGLRPFLARLFGKSARVPSLAFETRIDVSDRSDDVDELILVDPESDDVVDYSAEGFEIDVPSRGSDRLRTALALAGVGSIVGIGVGLATTWLWGSLVAGGAIVASILRPVDGDASVDPARAHVRSAWISALALERDIQVAKSLESAQNRIVELQGEQHQEIQDRVESQDRTLIASMLGTDPDRSVESGTDMDLMDSTIPDDDEDRDDESEGST